MGAMLMIGPHSELMDYLARCPVPESVRVKIISDTALSSSALGNDPVAITHVEDFAREYMQIWTKRYGYFLIWALRVYVRKKIKALGYVADHESVDHALAVLADHYRLHRSGRGHVWIA